MLSNPFLKHMHANKKCLMHHLRFFISTSRPFISLKLTPEHEPFPFEKKVYLLNKKNGNEKKLTQDEVSTLLNKNKTLYMTTGTLIIK